MCDAKDTFISYENEKCLFSTMFVLFDLSLLFVFEPLFKNRLTWGKSCTCLLTQSHRFVSKGCGQDFRRNKIVSCANNKHALKNYTRDNKEKQNRRCGRKVRKKDKFTRETKRQEWQ